MKVEQLIEILKGFNQKAEVLVTDADMNTFSQIDEEFAVGAYMEHNGQLDFGLSHLDETLELLGFTEEDVVIGEPAIVIIGR